ncbi:MAG TPA: MMPL family transporter [Polyangiaceae bacterium]|nr:MMPL family transporter [Polyangiaceae bacterium]
MFGRWLLRLAALQVSRPWWVIAVVVLSLVPAGVAASQLTLRTAFSELLPDSKPSVVEMRRVSSRLSGSSTLTVVIEGERIEALKKLVDALSPRILALGPDLVAGVDDGTRAMQKFFEDHEYLYADVEDLRKLEDEVGEAYDAEVARASGMDLGLDDEPPKHLSVDDILGKLEKKANEAKESAPGTDGYYIGENGKLAAILVRTPLGSGDPRAFELRETIGKLIREIHPEQWDPKIHFGFSGNLITSAEQQHAITSDLAHVGMWGVGMILGVVYLFFLRLRTLLAMGLTILVGCLWSFGVARFSVGYLNTATGFLVSIIVGNGINFGIIYMGRYTEARRDEHKSPDEAVVVAQQGTWKATLSVAVAAMTAYGSLSATDFRGFKHFGVIGGAGMLLCWVATYAFLPAILVVTERVRPMFATGAKGDALSDRLSHLYGRPFAWLSGRYPGAVVSVFGVLAIAGIGLAAKYLAQDPMEYDLSNIRNEDTGPTPARLLGGRVDKIVGRLGQDGRAILADRLDQVGPLVAELERRRDAAPPGDKPFSKVVSIYSLVPDHQEEKIALVTELKTKILKARQRKFVTDDDWKRLAPHIPDHVAPIGIADLPEQLARPFTEKDGTRGRIVYIAPSEGKSLYDAHYLMKWADTFREVKLPSGEIIRGSGDPVIFSDMLQAIGEEAPKAIGLSFLGTVLVVLFTFRGRKAAFVTLATLVAGLAYLTGFLDLHHVKLNFLSFVALPISIGVGADYALNVMARRVTDPEADLHRVVVETGGAVILCSLTTTLGYLALLLSINRAVQSFGLVAAVGEVTTLLAAVLGLPSYLALRERRSR